MSLDSKQQIHVYVCANVYAEMSLILDDGNMGLFHGAFFQSFKVSGAGEMFQWVKILASKVDNLSCPHMVERENRLQKIAL